MNTGKPKPYVQSIAMRVSRMDAMLAFYSEAFGIRFQEVIIGPFKSQFGELDGLTLKFVPIRDEVDFDGYAVHQLGFSVQDVEHVIALAIRHGGRREGDVIVNDEGVNAAVRDPDGNTIELYSEEN
jgi:predicted enzyme related to lactoylglutathione lyase